MVWTDLKTRRKHSRILNTGMFKILNELVEIPINDHLIQQTKEHMVGTIRPINTLIIIIII